jgi:hypothetical protein
MMRYALNYPMRLLMKCTMSRILKAGQELPRRGENGGVRRRAISPN